MANQSDFKTLLGPCYDENAHYYFLNEDNPYFLDVREVGGGDDEYYEGGMMIPTILQIPIHQSYDDFIDKDWVLKQPLDKIKNLSMYNDLVKNYGFKDEDYLDGNIEALENYFRDLINDSEFFVNLYLKEYFEFTRESCQSLKEEGACLLRARWFDIENAKGVDLPVMFEELGIIDKILAKTKEEFGATFGDQMPRGMHQEIAIYKE